MNFASFLSPRVLRTLSVLFVFVFFGLVNSLEGQRDMSVATGSQLEYQILRFTSWKDIYVKWRPVETLPMVEIKVDGTVITEREPDGHSLILKNVPNTQYPRLEITFRDATGQGGFSQGQTLYDRQPGIVHMNENVYQAVNTWTNTSLNLIDFLAGISELHDAEVYSFLQDFFSIDAVDFEALVIPDPNYDRFLENKEAWKSRITSGSGGGSGGTVGGGSGSGGGSDSCNCNLLYTNSSAFNRPNLVGTSEGAACGDGRPRDLGINHLFPDETDDEVVLSSILGVGKGFAYFINGDGFWGIDIGTAETPRTRSLPQTPVSRIRYKLVCADSFTIKPNNECKCTKSIDVEWEYASRYDWHTDDRAHGKGSSTSFILEDWAILTMSSNSGSEVLDQNFVSKRGSCESTPITSTFTDLADVVTSVQLSLDSSSVPNVLSAATSVVDFFGTVTSLAECNDIGDSTVTMLSGVRENIELTAGEQVMISMTTGAVLGGHVQNSGESSMRIISEGYLAGVLWSTDNGENSDACCTEEKVGSYALSSLSDFIFEEIPPVDDPEKCKFDLDVNVFNTAGPIGGLSSVRTTVSSFLGINGPWGGVFDPTGCCDDVIVDCFTKCGVYRNCTDDNEFTVPSEITEQRGYHKEHTPSSSDAETITQSEQRDSIARASTVRRTNKIIAFPNPVIDNRLIVEVESADDIGDISLTNASGQIFKPTKIIIEGLTIHIVLPLDLPSGLYLLNLKSVRNSISTKIVKL